MDKVAEVQAALASGTYDVPAAAVAGKMIDQILEK
jgi:anti-sigma28 factor (negative regulator of flagellin synthesis)